MTGKTQKAEEACKCTRNNAIINIDEKGYSIRILIDRINKRLRVMEYEVRDWGKAVSRLDDVAVKHDLGKILFYVKPGDNPILNNFDYIQEGVISAFFQGKDAICYSRFTDPERAHSPYLEQEDRLLEQVKKKKKGDNTRELPAGFKIDRVNRDKVDELVEVYRKIFSTYPSPLLDPGYVREVIDSRIIFYGAFTGDRLVSAASADMDMHNRNAEITDCATLPEYRGRGLLSALIYMLEKEMQLKNIGVLYSLARAGSYGMNAALHRLGYNYRGRFVNNCHIGGRFENMNLWVKPVF